MTKLLLLPTLGLGLAGIMAETAAVTAAGTGTARAITMIGTTAAIATDVAEAAFRPEAGFLPI